MLSGFINLFTPSAKQAATDDARLLDNYVVTVADDAARWEAQLLQHPLRNVYTSWGWGDYKARIGWRVQRLSIRNSAGQCLAMAQVQTRRRFGVRHVYIHGGPLFFATDDTVVERSLAALLAHVDPGPFGFTVLNYERFDTPTALLATLACGLAPALNRAQHTIVLDLSIGLDAIRKGLRRLWSKQLGKALANDALSTEIVEDEAGRDAAFDAFEHLYVHLARRKGFDMAIVPEPFRALAVADQRFVFLVVRERGEIVAVRIAHRDGDRLIDHVNASGPAAMASNANTLAVWRLIEHAVACGLRIYDFCGIDPVANPGVYRFKRGIGGDVVQAGPLWVHARNPALKAAVQAMLTVR